MDFIKTLSHPPKIIMTTAYAKYAAESYEENAIKDYLVKPFSFERFLKAVNKLEESAARSTNFDVHNSIFINVDKTQYRIYFKDILYIQSDRNYITLVTKNKKLTYIASLKDWLDKLPKDNFLQIHKSYIVNCNSITKIVGNSVYLEHEKLAIGRVYKSKLWAVLYP